MDKDILPIKGGGDGKQAEVVGQFLRKWSEDYILAWHDQNYLHITRSTHPIYRDKGTMSQEEKQLIKPK